MGKIQYEETPDYSEPRLVRPRKSYNLDIRKRRFKIIERIGKRFLVCCEIPRYKQDLFLGLIPLGKPFLDEEDLYWGLMAMDGNPLDKFDMQHGKPSAEFKSMSAAREFIQECKEEKRETII
jgi:hypothetical protein